MNAQDFRSLQEAYLDVYQELDEAEVLAMKGGVAGSVKVRPALSIPGTSIGIGPNKPVPGTFTTTTPAQKEKIAKGDTTIDRGTYQQSRVGAGPTSDERKRYNREVTTQGTGGKYMKQDYEYDAFDYILEYLISEGYAETSKQAQVIMVNMSEEWRENILEMSDFEAGGGNAKIKQTGMSKDQVVGLGKKNLANLAKKQTPQQSQKSSQVPAVKPQRQFTPPKSKTISGVGKPAAARASEIGSVTAADKFHAYNDSQNRADDVASWMGVNRKDPKVKKFADTNYRQNIALKTNDPKYDPTKTSYPDFTPRKRTGREAWDKL